MTAAADTLARHFERFFEAERVRDAATRREVLRLRYAVYCEELRYEDAAAFPDGEETDAYDAHCDFVLVRHRASGRPAGCMRLVANVARLPFEPACAGRLHPDFAADLERTRAASCEVSRLAVHQDFRRRRGEAAPSGGSVEAAARSHDDRQYPLIAMGLFLSAAALFLDSAHERVWVMMEPRLARLLSGCGLRFTAAGEVVEHHGRRGPFRITRPEVLPNLRDDARELLDRLRAALK